MDKISSYLKDILNEYNIDLIFSKFSCSGYYHAKENVILINEELLETQDVNFTIAHELGHFIKNHKEISALYQTSFVSNSKFEYEANFKAIELLLEAYLVENEITLEQLNYEWFISNYNISTSLTYCVEKVLDIKKAEYKM